MLGGSSSINGLVYIRGQPRGFRRLGDARLVASANCCRTSGSRDQSAARRAARQGGPLAIRSSAHELCDAFIASAQSLGIPRNDDFNGERQEGTGYYQATVRNGRRSQHRGRVPAPGGEAPEPRAWRRTRLPRRILFEGKKAIGGPVPEGQNRSSRRRQAVKSSCAAAPSIRRSCCSSPASGPARCCRSTASRWCTTRPTWASTCRTTSTARTFWRCNQPITLNDDMLSLWRRRRSACDYLLLSQRTAHRERGPCGRVRAHAAGTEAPRRADSTSSTSPPPSAAASCIPWSGFTLSVSPAAGRVARLGAHPSADPRARAGDPLQLPRHRERPAHDGRRPADRCAASRPPRRCAGYIVNGGMSRARRCRATKSWLAVRARDGRDRVPPDLAPAAWAPTRARWWIPTCA